MTMTYNELFIFLSDLAKSKNMSLSFATKDFFFSLVNYCEEHGYYDYEKAMFVVEGSFRRFMTLFDIKSLASVQKAVNSLEELGILYITACPPKPTIFYIDFADIELKNGKE